MLKKIISISLALALGVCVNLPIKASAAANNVKTKTLDQSVKFIKNMQAKGVQQSVVKKPQSTNRIYSLPAQPFYVEMFSDTLNTNMYSRNQEGNILQKNFPLIVGTYQQGQGDINYVNVDGKNIRPVYSEDEFYSVGDNEAVFFVVEKDPADSTNESWYNDIAVSTLTEGKHTIEFGCKVNGTQFHDSIRINVYKL